MADIILGQFNTILIKAGTVSRLKGWASINRAINLLNLGPGNIFVRSDLDPTAGDVHSLQLPPNFALNDLATDARIGLGVTADADTTISVSIRP